MARGIPGGQGKPGAPAPSALPPSTAVVDQQLLAMAEAMALPQTLRALGAPPQPARQMNSPQNMPVYLQGQRLYKTPYGDLAVIQPNVTVLPNPAPLQQTGPGIGLNQGLDLFRPSPPQGGPDGEMAQMQLEQMRAPMALGQSLDAQLQAMQAAQGTGPAPAGMGPGPNARGVDTRSGKRDAPPPKR